MAVRAAVAALNSGDPGGAIAIAPLSGAAANVTLLSHCETCTIGITTDARAIPDTEAFTAATRAGLDEVLSLRMNH